MKSLLIVDDDKNFLLSLADMFKSHAEKYSIYLALDGIEAVEVLANNKIDLVITDLKMPGMDGFGLIAHMSSRYKGMPVIVMTAFSSPETSDRLDSFGIFQYIEKPIDFDLLLAKVNDNFKVGSKGRIAGVSLASFMQLLGLDSKTCTLKVSCEDEVGVLYFKQGELFDAFTGNLRGIEAAFTVVGWDPVEIEIENFCRKDKRVIQEPLGFILIEGARRKDEGSAGPQAEDEDDKRHSKSEEADEVLDIDFNATAPPPDMDIVDAAATISGQTARGVVDNSMVDLLVSSIESFGHLKRLAIVKKDGEIITARNAGEDFGYFIGKVALESFEMGITLNLEELQYVALTLAVDRKLVIVCGLDVFLGMEIETTATPSALRANLAPVLKRARFD